jgi:hypothetical protein
MRRGRYGGKRRVHSSATILCSAAQKNQQQQQTCACKCMPFLRPLPPRAMQCAHAGSPEFSPTSCVLRMYYGPVWHSSASPVKLFFRKQLHEQLHERGREPCFCSFTMCLTLWAWVFREADQRVGQRVGCLAIEVVKLLVKLLMKLYQTGPILATPFTLHPAAGRSHAWFQNVILLTRCCVYLYSLLDSFHTSNIQVCEHLCMTYHYKKSCDSWRNSHDVFWFRHRSHCIHDKQSYFVIDSQCWIWNPI